MPPVADFWKRVRKTNSCWYYLGSVKSKGYVNCGQGRTAHRVAWELANGAIPPKTHVLHTCRKPNCVNPAHLFLSTGYTRSIQERFSTLIKKTKSCWYWLGARTKKGAPVPKGYGRFWDGKRLVQAHRFSWEQKHGKIPPNLQVLHTCDTPPCVNPDHLFLGTNADNIADRIKKGRPTVGSGEDNPRAKLRAQQVVEIRRRLRLGERQNQLAAKFNVCPATISHIHNNRIWKE